MTCNILKKKKLVILVGIMSVIVLCLNAPYKQGAGGNSFSVLGCILNKKMLNGCSVGNAFSAGTASLWFYMITPIIVSIPILSYISEVRRSAYSRMEMVRTGRIKCNINRLLWMFKGCAIILFTGLVMYIVILLTQMNLADPYLVQNSAGNTGTSEYIYGLLKIFIKKYVYMQVYSYTVSVLAAIIVYFYNDLFVVLSIVFSLIYVARNNIFEEKIVVVIVVAAVLSLIFVLLGKWSERT